MFDAGTAVFHRIGSTQVFDAFRENRELIERALRRGHSPHSIESLMDAVLKDKFRMWRVTDERGQIGLFVLSIYGAQPMRFLEIVLVAGKDFHLWDKIGLDFVNALGREEHCTHLFMMGRHGWKRRLRALGWQEGPITMLREVPR